MNREQANQVLINLWLEKAAEALASARLELAEGHLGFALNRLYYGETIRDLINARNQ